MPCPSLTSQWEAIVYKNEAAFWAVTAMDCSITAVYRTERRSHLRRPQRKNSSVKAWTVICDVSDRESRENNVNSIGQITFNFLQNIIITSCSWNGQSLFQGIQIIGTLLLSVASTGWKSTSRTDSSKSDSSSVWRSNHAPALSL